jgi:hypothetical protein
MDLAIIISLATLVLLFLGFLINVRKELTNSYNEAKNALSEQINVLKQRNDFLSQLTYKNYLEEFNALKKVYEAKLKNNNLITEAIVSDSKTSQNNVKAIEEISTKLDSIAKDITLQFESKSMGVFKITNPKESEAYEEWLAVSGIGAPANYKILLFTWLKNVYSSLQPEITTSDQNGNWSNPKCHLSNIGSYREIYAIAVEPGKEALACSLFNESGKRINPITFQTILEKNGIKSCVSIGKKLIRIDKTMKT